MDMHERRYKRIARQLTELQHAIRRIETLLVGINQSVANIDRLQQSEQARRTLQESYSRGGMSDLMKP